MMMQQIVRYVMSKVESPGLQKERKERYMTKRKLLDESLGQPPQQKQSATDVENSENITREALEDEARRASMRGQDATDL